MENRLLPLKAAAKLVSRLTRQVRPHCHHLQVDHAWLPRRCAAQHAGGGHKVH